MQANRYEVILAGLALPQSFQNGAAFSLTLKMQDLVLLL